LADAMEPRGAFRLSGFSKDVDGRHLEFQDSEPALPTCALCGLVPAATYKLTCKHIFCPACFTGVVQKTKTSLHCPVDGKSFRPKKALSSSSKASVSVLKLVVFCFNKRNGCSFFGTVSAMLEHFGVCPCWELTCQLCQSTVLRSSLVSHVETVHLKRENRPMNTRSSSAMPGPSTSVAPSVMPGTSAAVAPIAMQAPFVAVAVSAASPVTAAPEVEPSRSSQDFLKAISKLISRSTDDIKMTQELHLARLLSNIDSLKRQPGNTAGLVGFPTPRLYTAYSQVVDVVDGKERKTDEVVPYTLYHWSVSPFSRLRVGIHHFSSDVFMIAPGYNVQLKGCIDGIATVELKVEVTIRSITGASKANGDKALLDDDKLFTFKIVNNNSRKESIFTAYLFEDTFGESSLPLDSPDGVTSGWMDVGVIDRAVFERDFVDEDSFLIIFGIADTPIS
ncbi:hypothetical protein IscW_ISCW024053, partial [Ixodes scapularis]